MAVLIALDILFQLPVTDFTERDKKEFRIGITNQIHCFGNLITLCFLCFSVVNKTS